ncbi:inorganic pyrophosphatase [Lingula anatina]|uniref:Inorganic pyrophosphatase n=1 Tax=Lingula anatina TaxID=7574 RepID=A0A1S3HKP3_LINAN|nr:inorganic pyrophosphatase [Lingula anatina]|eukprot:XP_013386036.1 inorganic pyrophosphatase [Lingula anatina]
MQRGWPILWRVGRIGCPKSPFLKSLRSRQRLLCTQIIRMSSFTTVECGAPNSLEYRMFFKGPQGLISPFHDIPLYGNAEKTVFNMVVEVPRWTNAKMEIATKEKLNPIKQDVKKGKLRYVKNCFPHHGYIWNYGALPQTWEHPAHVDENTKCKGDNDPIDVCEIGYKVHKRGAVVQVKVLGTFALIDEGETDWKLMAIDVNDPLADKLNDINDVETHLPGLLKATTEWFRIYKIPDGKPENQFAFNGAAKNKEFALKVIEDTNKHWKEMVAKQTDSGELTCENTTVAGSPFLMTQDVANKVLEACPPQQPAQPISPEVDKWHFVKL